MASATPATAARRLTETDIERIRSEFPILRTQVHGKPLVYLDNAATTQKPQAVIQTVSDYYTSLNSNIHRGVHLLSEKATRAYERARIKMRKFINAREDREIIFVRGATEGINLVASSFGRSFKSGDEIIVSAMEHHSNIVPWQMIAQATGAVLKVIPMSDRGELDLAEYERLLGSGCVRMVAVVHVSNALGTINPVERITQLAHGAGAKVLVDAAQSAPHLRLDVQKLDCDFLVLSGHKLFAPTGIGVLYGKRALLEAMPPYQGGGDMIRSVSFEKTTYNDLPYKFEAGTPHIEGGIGLGAAIDYLETIGMDAIAAYEHELLAYATEVVGAIPGVRLIGTAADKASVLSFLIDGIHPHDIGTIIDREGVAIRTGHHCAQPVMDRLGIPATARASIAFYNTRAEIDQLARGIQKVKEVLG